MSVASGLTNRGHRALWSLIAFCLAPAILWERFINACALLLHVHVVRRIAHADGCPWCNDGWAKATHHILSDVDFCAIHNADAGVFLRTPSAEECACLAQRGSSILFVWHVKGNHKGRWVMTILPDSCLVMNTGGQVIPREVMER